MNDILFEFRGINYRVQYRVSKNAKENHYFIFPKEKEIIEIVGESFPMYISNLPNSNFNWRNSIHPLAEEVKIAVAKAIRETIK